MKINLQFWGFALAAGFCFAFAGDKSSPKTFEEKVKAAEIEVLEKGAASKAKKDLWVVIKAYWDAYEKGDFTSIYNMFLEEYRNEVSLESYLKRNRFDVTGYQIDTAYFWGDECARVVYRMQMNSEGMEFKKLPLRQYWVLRDGKWQLFEKPFKANPMFSRMKGSLKSPCPWPAKIGKDKK